MPKNFFDTGEIFIYRHHQGVKLIKPKTKKNQIQTAALNIQDLFKLPFSIFFLDRNSKLQMGNDVLFEMSNAASTNDIIGKNAFDVFKDEYSRVLLQNDQIILKCQQNLFFDEQILQNDGSFLEGLSLKFPWYGEDNKLLGIAGLGLPIGQGQASLAERLSLIAKLGFISFDRLIPTALPGIYRENTYLTKREIQILRYCFEGMTTRLIAQTLAISPRTVETHIENMKTKLNVKNKSELLKMTYHYLVSNDDAL